MTYKYKFRLKDSGTKERLKALAYEVNLVWNYSNEIIRKRWKESRFYTNRSDLNHLMAGASKDLDINSQTVQAVAYECLLRTKKAKKNVRWRSSKKGLGWVPFNGQTFKFHGGYCEYNWLKLRLWEHRKLPASAKINAKIKNARWDFSHKATHEIASTYRLIFMGDLNSAGLGKTRMAKVIYDSAVHQIKTILEYKARRHRGLMTLVQEQNTTSTCSYCLKKTGPSGLGGLRIREWTCENCGILHDRDHNSALNILRRGHATLSGEGSSFPAREAPSSTRVRE